MSPNDPSWAKIHPAPDQTAAPRPTGLGKGLAEIPGSFFDPLPDHLLDLFEGKTG